MAESDLRPARLVPLLYWGAAHLSLAVACFLVASSPRAVAGFFYHTRMVAIVHLVTLGWITLSIFGAIYIVGPLALRMPMPVRAADYAAYVVTLTGIVGMVGHFWAGEFRGMAWSTGLMAAGILHYVIRIVAGLRRAPVLPAVKLHITFACVNVCLAASMGILLGFDKIYHFLPGFVLSNVFAHAHLAAVGWATMMVVGISYRLLPMTVPSKMPEGPTVLVSAALLEAGVLGLFVSLLLASAWARLFGLLIVAGLASFGTDVARMLRAPRRRPPGAPGVDFALWHVAAAGVSLALAVAIGVTLLFAPSAEWTLRVALAYGVFGLLGFLAQMVVAMQARLLPLVAWFRAFAPAEGMVPATPPLAMRDPTLQAVVFMAWAFGVPAVAAGLSLDAIPLLAAGAWTLLAGVLVGMLDNVLVLVRNR